MFLFIIELIIPIQSSRWIRFIGANEFLISNFFIKKNTGFLSLPIRPPNLITVEYLLLKNFSDSSINAPFAVFGLAIIFESTLPWVDP